MTRLSEAVSQGVSQGVAVVLFDKSP